MTTTADVFPDATKIPARYLQPGDQVHDAHGTRYVLTSVRQLTTGTISTRREDHWDPTEPITVKLRSDRDPLHERIRGDVIIRLQDQMEYTVLRVITTRTGPNTVTVSYLVHPYHIKDFYATTSELSSFEFMKP